MGFTPHKENHETNLTNTRAWTQHGENFAALISVQE